jgi:hypothetical protein
MKKIVSVAVVLAAVAAGYGYLHQMPDVDLVDLLAPPTGFAPREVPADWNAELKLRTDAKAAYLAQKYEAASWFENFPFSKSDGIPYVILRLLPKIAPEIWGQDQDFGKSFGLFARTDSTGIALPVGIGMSGLNPDRPTATDFTSFTCGACHIGRVDLGNGQTSQIWGGVNAEFNITKFFVDFGKTLDILAQDATGDARTAKIRDALVAELEQIKATDPTYLYRNAAYGPKTFNAAYEAEQIEAFLADADNLVGRTVTYIDSFILAYGHYLDSTYAGYQAQMLQGLPGMADATGVSAAHGYELLETSFIGRLFAQKLLPTSPGLTDYMLVWDQDHRTAQWNKDGTLLVNGGGQYNGNIPIPIYRNLAASMTMGLEDTDLRVAAFAADLLGGLPAEPYPFDVDTAKAEKGRDLFAENCADCHQPNNGRVYRGMGTNLSRSRVMNDLLIKGGRSEYLEICGPETEVTLDGGPIKPCAEFDGRPITEEAIMRPLGQQYDGYNATALAGVWAGAPYLHNGSVPTIYHLLMPQARPASFTKSALNYDTEKLGFAWDAKAVGGYVFDTEAFQSISRMGHDKDITENGKTYKLDWSDDEQGAAAIIEYLKTL